MAGAVLGTPTERARHHAAAKPLAAECARSDDVINHHDAVALDAQQGCSGRAVVGGEDDAASGALERTEDGGEGFLLFGIEPLKGRLRGKESWVCGIVKAGRPVEPGGPGEGRGQHEAGLEALPFRISECIENAVAGERGHPENGGQIMFGIAGREGVDALGGIAVVGGVQRPYGVGAARKARGEAGAPLAVLDSLEGWPCGKRSGLDFSDGKQRRTLFLDRVVEPQNRFPLLLTTSLVPCLVARPNR